MRLHRPNSSPPVSRPARLDVAAGALHIRDVRTTRSVTYYHSQEHCPWYDIREAGRMPAQGHNTSPGFVSRLADRIGKKRITEPTKSSKKVPAWMSNVESLRLANASDSPCGHSGNRCRKMLLQAAASAGVHDVAKTRVSIIVSRERAPFI